MAQGDGDAAAAVTARDGWLFDACDVQSNTRATKVTLKPSPSQLLYGCNDWECFPRFWNCATETKKFRNGAAQLRQHQKRYTS